ncbi:MAG TPA: carboxypeptidase regulatory-like domain-containing protein [Longimicrobiales bacterium]|nr:carboxypeptidase regulatory-like domain-containing protein [Longimicrobiales bacterium]
MRRLHVPTVIIAFVHAVLLCTASHLSGQSIRGRIVSTGNQAISGAAIAASLGDRISKATSDSAGNFELSLPQQGEYQLRAERFGYVAVASKITVGAHQLVEITLTMSADAVKLDPITVRARGIDPLHRATYEGFLLRRQRAIPIGHARVVLREDPEMANATRISDVLSWFPEARCLNLFLNGKFAVNGAWLMELPVAMLAGMEFYRYESVAPVEFRNPYPRCTRAPDYSILVIWLAG